MTTEERDNIRMVLGYFGDPAGWQPGHFTRLILQAYQIGDPSNKRRVAVGFPELANLMDTVLDTDHGIADLRARLDIKK